MIRAIALDIDGTITYQNRQLDVTAVGVIRKAEESGILVCLATGNVLCFARTAAVLLGASGPLIAEDGGIVYDQANEKEYVLGNSEKVNEAVGILKEEFDDVRHADSPDTRRTGLALKRTIDAHEASNILHERGIGVTAVDSGFAIHIRDSNINKGVALKKVASIIGCPLQEIAAIGDAPNDVEMLRSAGWSFAPANASSEAKKASSRTTEKPHGSGTREAIIQILKEM